MSVLKLSKKMLLLENSNLKFRMYRPLTRTCWIHDINVTRAAHGEFNLLYKKLRAYDEKFFSYLRMKQETFDLLLSKIESRLEKKETNYICCISPEERLVVTLRYLATGESFRSLAFHFRMGRSTVAEIVKETCAILWTSLKDKYMALPTTEEWYAISKKFYHDWNFPNAVGAIDGKHIKVVCPAHSGSMYYNYKQYFSILLQALVDADSKLIFVDIGAEGRQCDSGNFRTSSLFHALETNSLNIPAEKELPGTNIKIPFLIIGDGGYPLLPYLMRPFGQRNLDNLKRVYNYRLSRARRSVECCFGIMAQKWRILLKSIEFNVETAKDIVKAICILHNFLMTEERPQTPETHNDDRNYILPSINSQRTQYRFSSTALQTREKLVNYFNGVGMVPWQNDSALPENIIQLHNIV